MGTKKALIPNAARALLAHYAQTGIPKLTVVTGKAVGDGFALKMMCPEGPGADMVMRGQLLEISSMPGKQAPLSEAANEGTVY